MVTVGVGGAWDTELVGSELAALDNSGLPAGRLDELTETARGYLLASESEATRRSYASDWRAFTAWCATHEVGSFPADPRVVALHLTDYAAAHKASSVVRRAMGIAKAHRRQGLPSPTDHEAVRLVLAGIRRTNGMAPDKKSPLLTDDVLRLVATCDTDAMIGARDRALLLVGFMGAFRRSELVALNVDDVEDRPEGTALHVRRSKVDQEGVGRPKVLIAALDPANCPIGALRHWQAVAGITDGPLFRSVDRHGNISERGLSPAAVALIVKRAALAAGLDPKFFAGHSLRAGHVTQAKRNDATDLEVISQTHHRSADSIVGYVREADLFRHTSAKRLDL